MVRGDTPPDLEVLAVHRPRYDDWSLPKGKNDPGESSTTCALREVWEETGYRCRIVGSAGSTRYLVRGAPKEVDYFLMRPYRSHGFRSDEEVDELCWVAPTDALGLLTYDFDREMISTLPVDRIVSHTTLHLVRHAVAGDRSRWEGPDPERPLTAKGITQSKSLAEQMGDIGISRVLASPHVRCVQTVAPLGEQTGRGVETDQDLAEGAGPDQIRILLDRATGSTTVLCSHGDVIPALLERLEWLGTRFLDPHQCKKGSTWVIGHDGESFTQARHVPPPTA